MSTKSFTNVSPELLDNLLNIEYLIVFNNYGVTLFSIDIGKTEIPDLLISGLLQAIITMMTEISKKPQSLDKKENRLKVREISDGDYGFIIYYCQNNLKPDQGIIVATFCSKSCGENFKTLVKNVTLKFSRTFEKEILNFAGNVTQIEARIIDFFSSEMLLNYLSYIRIKEETEAYRKPNDLTYNELIDLILEFQNKISPSEGFLVSEIVEKALRKLDISYYPLLDYILQLISQSVLLPINKIGSINQEPKNHQQQDTTPQVKMVSDSIKDYETKIDNDNKIKERKSSIKSQREIEPSNDQKWVQDFLDSLQKSPQAPLSNENLIINTITREIEYEYNLEASRLLKGDFSKIKKTLNEPFLKTYDSVYQSINAFSGPKFLLNSKIEGEIAISGVKLLSDYQLVFFRRR